MECILYINNSDSRVFNKKLTPVIPQDAESPEIPINIIEDSSIIDPTFIFGTATNVMQANYMFVPELGRYYYITDKILGKNRITVKAHVDVLMSFNMPLKEAWVILDRQEHQYNLYMNDVEISVENPNNVRTINFTGGGFQDDSEFVLIIAGDNEGGEEDVNTAISE